MLLGPRSIAVSHRVVLCIAQFPGGSVGPVRVVRETEACSLCPDDSVLGENGENRYTPLRLSVPIQNYVTPCNIYRHVGLNIRCVAVIGGGRSVARIARDQGRPWKSRFPTHDPAHNDCRMQYGNADNEPCTRL